MNKPVSAPRRAAGKTLTLIGFVLAVIGGIMVLMPGPGYRYGFWGLGTAFSLIRWGAYCGGAGAIICLFGAISLFVGRGSRWRPMAVAGVVIGAIAIGVPWYWANIAQSVPPIHDITTDTGHPPAFNATLALRENAVNSPTYGGSAIAAQQHAAYPDIKPLHLSAAPDAVFDAALAIVRDNGWKVHQANKAQHKIEATATTLWFGFRDDVAIRIKPKNGGSVVDIRSASRMGKSDIGKNAARVRRLSRQLEKSVGDK